LADVADVEREIKEVLSRDPSELFQAAWYLISTGGKRLRPRLLLAFSDLFQGDPEVAIKAAASVEMLHNFTLIHDDIMDRDETRHGVPTTHVKFGEPLAILAGDVLQSESQLEMARAAEGLSRRRAMVLLEKHASITTDIARGQTLDMRSEDMDYLQVGPRFYYHMIRLKTAVLFAHACWTGAYIAGAGERFSEKAKSFGLNLGMAFQMADDILGLVGDPRVTGKPTGSDVRNGKKTMPILVALKNLSGPDRVQLLEKLKARDPSAIDLIVKGSGIDYTKNYMLRFRSKAEAALKGMPRGPALEEISKLLDSAVVREK
jgi:geranylgeranyl diphosphate synthase type I